MTDMDEPGDEPDPFLGYPFSAMFSAIKTIRCGTYTAADRVIEDV